MYQVVSYSVYMNLVKANIAGNNKEYQYCRNKRKNVETMGEGNITPTHVRSYKQSYSIRPHRMHLSMILFLILMKPGSSNFRKIGKAVEGNLWKMGEL